MHRGERGLRTLSLLTSLLPEFAGLEFCETIWPNTAMEIATKRRLTAQEYLAAERQAPTKSEFVDGEVFAMAGGSEIHSLLAVNLARELRTMLKGKPCKGYNSDMRLKVESTELYAYPDVQVACGDLRFEDAQHDTLLTPKIIVEVLSESTEKWNRGDKFWHYRHIPSFTDYVLVAQNAWLVEHYSRQPTGTWLLRASEGAEGVLHLASISCAASLMEIYANTDIKPDAKPATPKPELKKL